MTNWLHPFAFVTWLRYEEFGSTLTPVPRITRYHTPTRHYHITMRHYSSGITTLLCGISMRHYHTQTWTYILLTYMFVCLSGLFMGLRSKYSRILRIWVIPNIQSVVSLHVPSPSRTSHVRTIFAGRIDCDAECCRTLVSGLARTRLVHHQRRRVRIADWFHADWTFRTISVSRRQNLTFLCKIVPKAKLKNKKYKQTSEDVLRIMASLGSG